MTCTAPRRRIVFTGDILQTTLDGAPKMSLETHWLADLLRYQVSLASPASAIDVVSWDQAASRFDAAHFYALNGMTPSVAHWAALEAVETVSETALAYLASFFTDALVIGNTMSAFQTRVFDRLGVPYLDFILHPARFLDDLCFGIRTNVPAMFTTLQAYRHPDEAIFLEAAIHRAGLRRPRPADLAPHSGLFAAQHGIDKALVRDGRFCSIEDYADGLTPFVSRHEVVYVKPHPYAPETARVVALLRALAGSAARIRVVDENIYALLCNPHVSEVCGISSCAVYEAEYFGKAVTFLSDTRMHLATEHDEPESRRFVAVYDAFLMPGFWREILASVCEVAAGREIALPRKTSRLRNNLSLYWGYGHLDWERPLRAMGAVARPTAAPAISAPDSHAQGLLLLEHGDLEAGIEAFALAVAAEQSAERWTDWADAQLRTGRTAAASAGLQMADRERDQTTPADSDHTEAETRSLADIVRRSRGVATVVIGLDATSNPAAVRHVTAELYRQRRHTAFTSPDPSAMVPAAPPDFESAADAWDLAHRAADLFRLALPVPASMPIEGELWTGDPLVARLLACTGRTVLQLTDGGVVRATSSIASWLRSGAADVPVVEVGASDLDAARLASSPRSGAADVKPPTLLARLWLARLRGDADSDTESWVLANAPTWPAAIALVRCCVREREFELALAICREYGAAVSRHPAVAAEFDYLAGGAARALDRLAAAEERYQRVLDRSRSAAVPPAFVAGACYHLATIAEAAGQEHRAEELARECLRLVPVHQAAQALLARVHARALAHG